MWKRIAVAVLEGVSRQIGARAADELERWIDARRGRGSLDLNRCTDCGRPLCCAVHGADSRLVEVTSP